MKKILLVLLCITIVCIKIKAQPTPFLQWQKTYGGSYLDWAYSIQQTTDEGYIIAGFSSSNDGDVTGNHGGMDYWVVKTDIAGNIQWEKTYGGSNDDVANSIRQTADGGYVMIGYTRSNNGDVAANHGDADYWIVKTDASGDIQWQRTLGGSTYDEGTSIQQTTDGGYIVAGYSRSNDGDVTGNHGGADYWIVKLNASGDLQWQKSLGGSQDDELHFQSIRQTTDGGFILAGYTYSNNGNVTGNHGGADYWIVKLNASGNIQWQKAYGGSHDDDAKSIQQTTDGGYIVAGYSASNNGDVTGNHGDGDYWLVKTDAEGNIQWQKALGGSDFDDAGTVQQTKDNGYVVAGNSWSKDGDATDTHGLNDFWTVKVDSTGIVQWQKALGGSDFEGASCIKQTTDGGYIVAGDTWSNNGNVTGYHGTKDYWVVKLSPEKLNDSITIFPYHIAKHCAGTSDVSCDIKNKSKAYTVRLYRFGEIYDSALNVTAHTGFHDLPQGAYYVTATDNNGVVSYSEEIAVEPIPTNTATTNITATQAQLNWTRSNCADDYRVQFRRQGDAVWQTRQTGHNVMHYTLSNLKPSTTYVWKVGSRKRKNGIQAKGKFSDSVVFTTASAFTTTNQNNITINNNAETVLFNVSPNPAKNYFIINFKDDSQQKISAVLYDVNGKTIWSSGLVNAQSLNGIQVNTSRFAKGVFYLKLMNEQSELMASTKIVVAN